MNSVNVVVIWIEKPYINKFYYTLVKIGFLKDFSGQGLSETTKDLVCAQSTTNL